MVQKNITGQKFGRLTAIKPLYIKNNAWYWLFKCDCGIEKAICKHSVLNKKTTSCGCVQRNRVSKANGLSNSRIHRIWAHIKDRCYNIKNEAYKNYGGRGIKVCKEWKNSFLNFNDWAIKSGYMDDLTIDRINVNGNYEPSNCRWVTMKEQARNRRNNKTIIYNGRRICLSEISELKKVDWTTINNRLKRGLSLEKSIYFGNKIYRGMEIFCETNGKTYANATEFLNDVGLKKTGGIYDFLNGKTKSDNFRGYKIKRI